MDVNKEELRDRESEDGSEEFTGDGTVDRKGNTARRQKTGGWRAAPLIFATEICERMGSLGLQRNLVTYFTTKMHLSNPKASNMVSNFVGALYLTPFIGGFMADAYWGRFWAITVFACIQVVGMILLTLSAALPSLKPAPCPSDSTLPCPSATTSQLAVLYLGLYLIALGNGGIKPNVSSLGADQFDESYEKERKHMSSFFNWYYFIISVGSLLSVTVFVYIQDNVGFGWGFGIPGAVMVLAIITFNAGSIVYRYKVPRGSPLTSVAQVLVAAVRKHKTTAGNGSSYLYEGHVEGQRPVELLAHTNQYRFLDRAAMTLGPKDTTGPVNPWRLTTVTQVEEVKMLVKLFPIWLSTIIVWTALSQMETFSVEEGATMDHHMGRHFQFPPASLSVFELVNVLLILPLYDRFLVPFLRRFTGHPQGITQLQRIGTGIVFSILAMVVAGFVEVKRVNVARAHGLLDQPKVMVPISIFWLIPQYFLRGSTEIFTQIGQLEFFYGESPDRMRSLGTAIYLSTIACGHFLSSVLVTVVNRVTSHGGSQPWLIDNLNRSRLDYFYWFLAGLSFVNFLFFLLCAHFYRYKKVATFDTTDVAQRNNNILPNVEANV